jgi:hypothetical protein
MSFIRTLTVASVVLFGAILGAGIWKKQQNKPQAVVARQTETVDLDLQESESIYKETIEPSHMDTAVATAQGTDLVLPSAPQPLSTATEEEKDQIDRLNLLFNPYGPRLAIVQTIRYTPNVSWVKDRPAWIVDYASHYQTSKHFISRSLGGKKDYQHQEINPADRFNVLRTDIPVGFYLLVDVSRCKMRFYTYDSLKKEAVLLKTYDVQLGRRDEMSPSGCLTPLGVYRLGSRIAVYKPGMMGTFRKQKAEMVQIFGTRWIPFAEEVQGCTAPAKGYGIHGFYWIKEADDWRETRENQSGYYSDGCIRLKQDDIEEVFAIVVTRPTIIEICKQFDQAIFEIQEVEPVIIMNP